MVVDKRGPVTEDVPSTVAQCANHKKKKKKRKRKKRAVGGRRKRRSPLLKSKDPAFGGHRIRVRSASFISLCRGHVLRIKMQPEDATSVVDAITNATG